jgi:hypothetical protein
VIFQNAYASKSLVKSNMSVRGGGRQSVKSRGFCKSIGNAIDSGMGLSITIDKLRVFINKKLSILSAYQ